MATFVEDSWSEDWLPAVMKEKKQFSSVRLFKEKKILNDDFLLGPWGPPFDPGMIVFFGCNQIKRRL